MGLKEVINVRRESLQRQIDNIYQFITTPKGVFQTLDEAIRTFRKANRDSLRAVGITFMSRTRKVLRMRR